MDIAGDDGNREGEEGFKYWGSRGDGSVDSIVRREGLRAISSRAERGWISRLRAS